MPEKFDPSIYEAYEAAATQKGSYERLGDDPDPNWHKWGSVLVRREDGSLSRESFYNSPEITRRLFTEPVGAFLAEQQVPADEKLNLVDFGGATGAVLRQVVDGLAEDGFQNLNPVVVDKNEAALKEAQAKGLKAVAAGMVDPPFPSGTVDVALSRFSLQYLGSSETGGVVTQHDYYNEKGLVASDVYIRDFYVRDNQAEFFKYLYDSMRSDGIAVLVVPLSGPDEVSYGKQGASSLWNHIFSRLMKQNILAVDSTRSFPTLDELRKFAEGAGFKIRVAEEVDWIEFRFTPEAIFDRFELTPEQKEKVLALYQEALTGPAYKVDADPNSQAIRFPIGRLVITTEGKPPIDGESKTKLREDLYHRNFRDHADWNNYDVSEPTRPHLDPNFDKSLPNVPGWNPYDPSVKDSEK